MTTLTHMHAARVPTWLWIASTLGIAWNLYGVYQYAGTFTKSGQAAMTPGMTASQAAIYLSLPAWISAAFALGVLGGTIGSVLLARRRRAARPVLAGSLAGYAALFAGDAYYGVFAALPGQLAILAIVMVIAAAMAWVTRAAANRHLLR